MKTSLFKTILGILICFTLTTGYSQKKKIAVLVIVPDSITHYNAGYQDIRITKFPAKTNFEELVSTKLKDLLAASGLSESQDIQFIPVTPEEIKLGFKTDIIDKRNGAAWLAAKAGEGYDIVMQVYVGRWWDSAFASGKQYPGMGILNVDRSFKKPTTGLSVIYGQLRMYLVSTKTMKGKAYDASNETITGGDPSKPQDIDNVTYTQRPDYVQVTPITKEVELPAEKLQDIEGLLQKMFPKQLEQLVNAKKIEKDLLKM